MAIIFLSLILLIIIANALPVFPIPTWVILTYFGQVYGIDFVSLILIGIVASTIGRTLFALFSDNLLKIFKVKQIDKNINFIHEWIDGKGEYLILFTALYCASPVPSNLLYIPAGRSWKVLTQINIGHAIGRILNYSYSLYLANTSINLFTNIKNVNTLWGWENLLISTIILIISVLIFFIDFEKLIIEKKLKMSFR